MIALSCPMINRNCLPFLNTCVTSLSLTPVFTSVLLTVLTYCVVFVFVLCLMLSVVRISWFSILESLVHELTFIILLQREMLMILFVNRWNLQTFLRKKMNSGFNYKYMYIHLKIWRNKKDLILVLQRFQGHHLIVSSWFL